MKVGFRRFVVGSQTDLEGSILNSWELLNSEMFGNQTEAAYVRMDLISALCVEHGLLLVPSGRAS